MAATESKKQNGFTLVEIMLVVTIIMILSTTATISIRNFVLERRGEVQVVAFYNQLKTMRAFAQRDDVRYVVTIPAFTIHRNLATNPQVQLFSDQTVVRNALVLARVEPGTLGGLPGNSPTAEANFIFENDEIGTIGNGAVFLRNPHVNGVFYAIFRPAPANNRQPNEIQLWKRRGAAGAWTQL
jgi:prepilin-type N-terminal cleavage/methylation domain-containing protein